MDLYNWLLNDLFASIIIIAEIIVQYIKKDSLRKKSIPREIDWKRATQVGIKTEEDVINGETSGTKLIHRSGQVRVAFA